MTEDMAYLDQILQRMVAELPAERRYHSMAHTRDEVIPAAERLAGMLGVHKDEKRLLMAAAAFHDTGYMDGSDEGHEGRSVEIARETLPAYGYTPGEIDVVAGIIRATIWPQKPRNLLEQIMADADLAMLGYPWERFLARSVELREEIISVDGEPITEEEWFRGQIEFLSAHTYFTEAAHALFDEQKQRNIEGMRRRLESTGA